MGNNVWEYRHQICGFIVLFVILISTIAASAQQANKPFTAEQCLKAMKMIDGVTDNYRGRLSPQFLGSLVSFGRSGCDLKRGITRVEGYQDDRAYGEIRLLLIAMRTP
jgi:hypothetical protein